MLCPLRHRRWPTRVVQRCADVAAILSAPDIDAVIIGTPTDSHFDQIMGAAKHGKAIFCEKPVDMSVDNIRACMTAVNAAGVPFMTGFNRPV